VERPARERRVDVRRGKGAPQGGEEIEVSLCGGGWRNNRVYRGGSGSLNNPRGRNFKRKKGGT